jgi:hypothetical protein
MRHWAAYFALAAVGLSLTRVLADGAAGEAQASWDFNPSTATTQSGQLPLNVNQYTPAGYVASVAPLMSRAWHAPSGFQTAHLANGMTMNVPMDLPSTAVYAPTGVAAGMGGNPVVGSGAGVGSPLLAGAGTSFGGVGAPAVSALDPELAYVQQQQLAEKARIAQEIQALQYEAAMRARDVAMSNMGVHVAEQRLAHAQQLAHAVHARLAAAQRQLAALDVAQRRAADQSQLNQLQAALAEASASEAALQGARAGHQSLVDSLQASIKAASSRVDAATGAIEKILEGQGTKPTEIRGANGVTSDIYDALHDQLNIAKKRAHAVEEFQRTLSNAVPSAADLVTDAHEEITRAGEKARHQAVEEQEDKHEEEDTKEESSGGEEEDSKEEDDESLLQVHARHAAAAQSLRSAARALLRGNRQ